MRSPSADEEVLRILALEDRAEEDAVVEIEGALGGGLVLGAVAAGIDDASALMTMPTGSFGASARIASTPRPWARLV